MSNTDKTLGETQQAILDAIHANAVAARDAVGEQAEQYASAALKLVQAHRILGGY